MDNNRPKILMNTNPQTSEANQKPVTSPPVNAKTATVNVQSESPLAKGLPESWSVEPPESPVRRKGIK